MTKGRKPITNEMKVLRGTDQPCRMGGEVLNVDKITCFDQIKSVSLIKYLPTKRARAIFKSKANQLIALRVLTVLDLELLAVYANSLDVLLDCLTNMRSPATLKHNRSGEISGHVPRPEIALYRQMVEQVNRIGSDFGFTPISRQRINVEASVEESLFDKLQGI